MISCLIPRFAKLHDAGGGETFRMGGDAKPMTRYQRRAADDVGIAEGLFEDDAALVDDCDHAARVLGLAYLVLDPLREVVEGGLQPVVHVLHLSD